MPNFSFSDEETRRQVALKHYQAGATIFILKRGLLFWALPMFVLFTLYDYFINGYHNAVSMPALQHTVIVCVIAGLIVGSLMWLLIARRVHQTNRGE
jgi:ABC-type thiamin/hydroxymethylpyrimidine transport system permease subunit